MTCPHSHSHHTEPTLGSHYGSLAHAGRARQRQRRELQAARRVWLSLQPTVRHSGGRPGPSEVRRLATLLNVTTKTVYLDLVYLRGVWLEALLKKRAKHEAKVRAGRARQAKARLSH